MRRDLLPAVVRGDQSDAQAQALQDAMETLRELREKRQGGQRLGLSDARAGRRATNTIREVMLSGAVRPEDGQAVVKALDRLAEERGRSRRSR